MASSPQPASWSKATDSLDGIATKSYEALDLTKIAEDDGFNEAAGKPPRFAIPKVVAISPLNGGTWEQHGDTSIWRLRVTGEQTASFNFAFTRYRLPEGAQLFVYPADRSQAVGPYSDVHNNAAEQLWTPIVASSDVVIELDVPTAKRSSVVLELTRINQGYRGFGTLVKGYQQTVLDLPGEGKACKSGDSPNSGSCNTDVTCLSSGDPWNLPRRAVGAYSVNGSDACTGSLVNNTANDRRMLFMTATHCGVTTGTAPSVVAYWNYESPTCRRPGSAASGVVVARDPNISSTGATFRAATPNPFSGCAVGANCSDNTLIEFNTAAPASFNLYWEGWDRTATAAVCAAPGDNTTTTGLCASIHHPGVDEKRITFVERDFESGSIASSIGVHWHSYWDATPPLLPAFPAGGTVPPSVTEGGSSGSPLYNAQQRLVGVLSGGPSACGSTGESLSDFYGKFTHAWEGLGTPTTRLKDQLDPGGSAPNFINGIGASPFTLAPTPGSVGVCSTVGSASVSIAVGADAGFTNPISFTLSGAPTGSTASITPNPITPPGTATFTVSDLASATAGNYNVVVTGTSGTDVVPLTIPFALNTAAPGTPTLTLPASGATGIGSTPTLTWTAASQAGSYLVELASDNAFTTIIVSATVTGTSFAVTTPLAGATTYYWRVTPSNFCGGGSASAVSNFRTAQAPGQCEANQTPSTVFSDNVDGGVNGWTTTGSTGTSTWTRSTVRPNSGTHAWLAVDIATVSDQRLISPSIVLPANENPLTLSFANYRQIEQNGATGCYDGGLLEVSINGGTTFTQVPGSKIIGGGTYRGLVSTGFASPIGGLSAWCDDPARPYASGPVLVDLADYAGQTVNLRFRLGTDSSASKEGWYVDDIKVSGCAGSDTIFVDGFDSAD